MGSYKMFQVLQLKDNKVDKSPPREAFPGFNFRLKHQSFVWIFCIWVILMIISQLSLKQRRRKKKVFWIRKKVLEPDSRADGQKQRGQTQDVCINQGDSAGISTAHLRPPKHGPRHLLYRCPHQECPPFVKAPIKEITSRHVSRKWKTVRNGLTLDLDSNDDPKLSNGKTATWLLFTCLWKHTRMERDEEWASQSGRRKGDPLTAALMCRKPHVSH